MRGRDSILLCFSGFCKLTQDVMAAWLQGVQLQPVSCASVSAHVSRCVCLSVCYLTTRLYRLFPCRCTKCALVQKTLR